MPRDLGDFQTPPGLVNAVLQSLYRPGRSWWRVLEPTCGRGNFVEGVLALRSPPREINAIELQESHYETACNLLRRSQKTHVQIHRASIFDIDLRRDLHWEHAGPLLVIGNPPWVTNSELGSLRSTNLPHKSNIKGLRGIDALTGGSNFDIAEYIWLKLIRELLHESPTIALLCKSSVARNVIQYCYQQSISVGEAEIRKIDAKKWFGAAVDACLFSLRAGVSDPSYQVNIYDGLEDGSRYSTMGFVDGRFVSDVKAYISSRRLDGKSCATWRQGIKHDAADVMELTIAGDGAFNGLGEPVDVEKELIYPLLKSSDLFGNHILAPRKSVIVTQQRVGEDTRGLQVRAPRLWSYLNEHIDITRSRKSSIYKGQPDFAMFGIGPYSFSPYKVAVSGLYKTARFRLVPPIDGRPVMLDDTCYFVACQSAKQAALICSLLNQSLAQQFIESLVFWDAKRPITKKLLQRIDILALLSRAQRSELLLAADVELARVSGGQSVACWPENLEKILGENKLEPLQQTLAI